MTLSVVIVTYNSAHCIGECVQALARMPPNCEIIVVDNMSVDTTVATATATNPRVRIVQMGYDAGFGRAANEGVRTATHEHVLLVNPDVVVLDAERDELEAAFAEESFGLMAAELIAPNTHGSAQAQLAARRSWLSELLHMSVDPFQPRELSARRRTARVEAADWASGALLLVRRAEFLALGGFDERFFMYYEDQDLGARYRAANLPIRGTAAMRGTHRRGGSTSIATEDSLDRMAWCLLGWLEFVAVHYGPERARISWAILRRMHRAGRTLAALLARGSQTGRVAHKAAQMASLEDAIRDKARGFQHSAHGFCPVASRVVADVS